MSRRDQTRSRIQTRHRRRRRDADAAPSSLVAARPACWPGHRPALADAGVAPPGEVDGLGVASFSLRPDRAIDLGWRLGLKLNWCMQDEMGGASAINLLRQAWLALEAGQARTIVLAAGDHFAGADFQGLVSDYNRSAREYLSPLGCVGPNPLFAMLTQRQMMRTGLRRELRRAVRGAAAMGGRESNAAYRQPLSLRQYLDAPLVAPPLGRLDCVPVVSGACALVLSARPGRACDAAGQRRALQRRSTGRRRTGHQHRRLRACHVGRGRHRA